MTCTASVDVLREYPNSSSKYAREGSAAHYLADTCLSAGVKAERYLDKVIAVWTNEEGREFYRFGDEVPSDVVLLIEDEFEVDRGMVDAVQEYMDQVLELPSDYIQFETKVPIGWITGEEDASGTADSIRITGRTLAVHDLKYGQGVRVDAENNEQLMLYASGAARELDWMCEFENYEVHVHQPRLNHHDVWTFTHDELVDFIQRVQMAVGEIDSDPQFRPSDGACKFCSHKPNCDALANYMHAELIDDFPVLEDRSLLEDQSVLTRMLPKLSLFRDTCAAYEAAAIDRLSHDPESVPGWKLVAGRGSRAWQDEKLAEKTLRGKLKQKIDDVAPRNFCSPAQAEKLVGKRAYKENLAGVVENKAGRPTLAPESDKRPAIKSAEALGFENLDSEDDS